MNWVYVMYEWTWHLNTFGMVLWGTYLGVNSFAWLFIPLGLMYFDPNDKHPYRNTLGVWTCQLLLFLFVGIVGWVFYNF